MQTAGRLRTRGQMQTKGNVTKYESQSHFSNPDGLGLGHEGSQNKKSEQ